MREELARGKLGGLTGAASLVVDLALAQQRMEADLARAARLAEAAKAEHRMMLEPRDDLLVEAARLRRDVEDKDNILSAMLRKSKIDMKRIHR